MTAQNLTSKKSYFGSYIRYRIFKNKNLLILSFVFSAMYMLLFTGCMMFCTGFVNDFINSGAITEEGVSKPWAQWMLLRRRAKLSWQYRLWCFSY